ncbi:MAG: BlaI/MecI/CopY family transcriptional regulator [Verrucomicrobiaceae bacterium]|nr:BlaI/MecI/CopY family transcriptional regulator [Verrucomicrobiaceae bacterium]
MADTTPRISEAEWTVMKVLWDLGEASLGDVVRALENQLHWKPRTVQTLVRRLVEKGAVTTEANGRDFRYRPAIGQNDCQIDEGRSFLRRVFDGRLTPFVAALMEKREVSRDELQELKQLLEQAEKKLK